MKLIVGLGNPGKKYEGTRHNLGWEAVSSLAESLGVTFQERKEFRAHVAETRMDHAKILLILPLTYMNLSGEAVRLITQFYKISLEDVLIVHDEMDFLPGRFAFTAQNGPAGHNGVASIQETCGTDKIARLRIGIGRPTEPVAKEVFVLQVPSLEEKNILSDTRLKVLDALKGWISQGTTASMNTWNG